MALAKINIGHPSSRDNPWPEEEKGDPMMNYYRRNLCEIINLENTDRSKTQSRFLSSVLFTLSSNSQRYFIHDKTAQQPPLLTIPVINCLDTA
ncbi:hypothetical protein CEXT_5341 [Caerostris extrusa]|uniref:Uncharacterized protein n=1 Tax=Caerostris extrusa TaxID=172846 RepID=A0AAV4S6B4_CAEEX|nr:hypothetical protein CEXT_5341 [Caerostris extrusa]